MKKKPPLIIEFCNPQRFQTLLQELRARHQALWFLAASDARCYWDSELLRPSMEVVADRLCSKACLATCHGDWEFHLPEVQNLLDSKLSRDMWTEMLWQITFYEDLANKCHTSMISTRSLSALHLCAQFQCHMWMQGITVVGNMFSCRVAA